MAVKLLLLCALALTASAAKLPALQQHAGAAGAVAPRPLHETPCEFCEQMVLSVEDYLADNETQARITAYIDQSLCVSLPGQFGEACRAEVPALVASATQAVLDAVAPEDVCEAVGVCAPTVSLSNPRRTVERLAANAARRFGGPLDCPVCKMIVMSLIARLEDPTSRAEIEKNVRAACNNLPLGQQAKCNTDVSALFSAIDALLGDVDPEGVCELADFCSPDSGAARPAALARLRGLAVRLQAAPRAPAGSAHNSLQDPAECDTCKTIVMEAAAILTDPKTQTELLEYAKQGCAVFQDFKDQCVQYVTLYGPLVLNMAITYLQPEPLCARLGYCPAPPPPFLGVA